jgi:hypothetical protein
MSTRTGTPYHRITPDPEYHSRCVTPIERRSPLAGQSIGFYAIRETLPEAPCGQWIAWCGSDEVDLLDQPGRRAAHHPGRRGHYRHLPGTFWTRD